METPEVDRIRTCIDHYMAGESTQEELRLLKSYFNGSSEIPADLLPYREMFAIIGREPVRLSADAVRRLSRIGDNRNGVRLWPWIAAACAVILLLVLTTPPKGGSVVQPQFAEAEAPQPSAPAPEISDTVREDALRENAVLDKSTQTDTVTGKISPKDVMHFALPQALKTAVAETDNEPEHRTCCYGSDKNSEEALNYLQNLIRCLVAGHGVFVIKIRILITFQLHIRSLPVQLLINSSKQPGSLQRENHIINVSV